MNLNKFYLFRYIITAILVLPVAVYSQAYNGYTLFSPNNSRYTYLINMNNEVLHTWSHTKSGGYSCYLLEDGSLLRPALSTNSSLGGGGEAGVVQKYSWDGSLIWEYTYSSSNYRTHHDIEPMPNGNVLLIAWEVKTAAQAVQAGLNHSASIWPDHIIEVEPVGSNGGNIIWQWHFWDHLVQDYNSTKSNYGVVAGHPELLNINEGSSRSGDWTHINGISYNPDADEIVISSHNLDEIYVIDHSTTTAEAASHSGGKHGKGGDILYRWGKPSNYGASGTQIFNVVHSSVWIPDSYPGEGNIMVFNNREGQGTSQIVELTPPKDDNGNYILNAGSAFGPTSPTWTYSASGFYSNHLGGVQRFPNGNTLIVESTSGYMFEVNSSGSVIWDYNYGREVVRALRYAPTYSGILLNDSIDADDGLVTDYQLSQNYPNPFNPETVIQFKIPVGGIISLKVYDNLGREIVTLVDEYKEAGTYNVTFNASEQPLSSGVYFYRLVTGNKILAKKMVYVK